MTNTNLARLLRLYRHVNEISTRELGKAIGVGHATISRVERGYAMDLDTWLKIQNWLLR